MLNVLKLQLKEQLLNRKQSSALRQTKPSAKRLLRKPVLSVKLLQQALLLQKNRATRVMRVHAAAKAQPVPVAHAARRVVLLRLKERSLRK